MGKSSSGNVERVALWTGGLLAVAGAVVLLGYGLFFLSRAFFGSHNLPILVQIAVPAVIIGPLVAFGGVLAKRLRRRGRDQLDEVDY